MKANWGFLTTLASDLKSDTAVLMRERANDNKKTAVPMRGGGFENSK
jgi:hypothetical protein